MIINLEKPFSDDWRKGYLRQSKDGRKRIDLFNSDKDRTTISYARYLICVSIGEYLSKDYEVDHINGDNSDDKLENLQVLRKEEHLLKSARERTTGAFLEHICPECGTSFRKYKCQIGKDTKNAFCSRSCNGKFNFKLKNFKIGTTISEEKISKIKELQIEGYSAHQIAKIVDISFDTAVKYMNKQ